MFMQCAAALHIATVFELRLVDKNRLIALQTKLAGIQINTNLVVIVVLKETTLCYD